MPRTRRVLLLAFGIANAVTYSALQPLWEGFDEAFHYGYVDHLAATGKLPVLGETRVSREIWTSLERTPVSHVVQQAWPSLETFDQYFALSDQMRREQRVERDQLPHDTRDSSTTNYEAQQPPLAYAVLAGPDRLLGRLPIARRVFWLRLMSSLLAMAITAMAARGLLRSMRLDAVYEDLGLFCIFACQMFWATVAHVGNDWLALPLSIWFFGQVSRYEPRRSGSTIGLALATALGLLTKAYFLPLALLAALEVAWVSAKRLPVFLTIVAVLAGPWYWRNAVLYHNPAGLLMTQSGVRPAHTAQLFAAVDWRHALPYMLRATLWTGNNSFTTFSQSTLNVVLAILAAGLAWKIVNAIRRRDLQAREGWLWGALVVYGAAIVWVTVNDVEFLAGRSAGAAPWYTIVLLAPLLGLSLAGLRGGGRMGRIGGIAVAVLFAYMACATYVVKLIPLYSGFSEPRGTLPAVFRWYSSGAVWRDNLSNLSMAPWYMICVGTLCVVALAIAVCVSLVRDLMPRSTVAAPR